MYLIYILNFHFPFHQTFSSYCPCVALMGLCWLFGYRSITNETFNLLEKSTSKNNNKTQKKLTKKNRYSGKGGVKHRKNEVIYKRRMAAENTNPADTYFRLLAFRIMRNYVSVV